MFLSNTPAVFNNNGLNAPGSQFAVDYTQATTKLIRDEFLKMIFDDTPAEDYEIPLAFMNAVEEVSGDEFQWLEMQRQRVPIETPVLAATIASGTTQQIPVLNPTDIGRNRIIVHPTTNQGMIVTDVNVSTSIITVNAFIGETLPQLTIALTYKFANATNADGDGTNNIDNEYRMDKLLNRYNLVQVFAASTRFNRIERLKYENLGTTNYLEANRDQMIKQFKMDLGVQYWNGRKGLVTLADGKTQAKVMQGIYPGMLAAGSPQVNTSMTNIVNGLFSAAYSCRFGKGVNEKFFYAKPEIIGQISRQVKFDKMRWEATNDFGAQFNLEQISDSSNNIVLVPCNIFQSSEGMLPPIFDTMGLLVDQRSISPVQMKGYGMRMGGIKDRSQNDTTLNNFSVEYVETSFSQRFKNPLGSCIVKIG